MVVLLRNELPHTRRHLKAWMRFSDKYNWIAAARWGSWQGDVRGLQIYMKWSSEWKVTYPFSFEFWNIVKDSFPGFCYFWFLTQLEREQIHLLANPMATTVLLAQLSHIPPRVASAFNSVQIFLQIARSLQSAMMQMCSETWPCAWSFACKSTITTLWDAQGFNWQSGVSRLFIWTLVLTSSQVIVYVSFYSTATHTADCIYQWKSHMGNFITYYLALIHAHIHEFMHFADHSCK